MVDMVLDRSKLNQIDLHEIYSKVDTKGLWKKGWDKFLFAKPGDWQGYHKLLAYLSTYYNNKILLDIGTLTGASSLSLSYNQNNFIYSFDLPTQTFHTGKVGTEKYTYTDENQSRVIQELSNIKYIVDNFFNHQDLLLKSSLIYLDIDHSGAEEKNLIDFLLDNNWSGIMILDDIKWNTMTGLWKSLTIEKYDISYYGNGKDGTGLINFNSGFNICTIN